MKISEIISEANTQSLSNPVDPDVTPVTDEAHLVEILKANCSTIVEAYREASAVIWRGVKNATGSGGPVFISKIRQDRKPIQMHQEFHDLLNQTYNAFGVKAHRGNSIFCTTDIAIASDWGAPCAIFPKDGWVGSYIPEIVEDYSFFHVQQAARAAIYGMAPDDGSPPVEKVVATLRNEGWVPKEFSTPAETASILEYGYVDLLITGDSYIAIRNSAFLGRVLNQLGINLA